MSIRLWLKSSAENSTLKSAKWKIWSRISLNTKQLTPLIEMLMVVMMDNDTNDDDDSADISDNDGNADIIGKG